MPPSYLALENLNDGTSVIIRAIKPEDAAKIREAFADLDPESVYMRFFTPKKELRPSEVKDLTEVDGNSVTALVIMTPDGTLIGGGRFAKELVNHPQSAELAFLTAGRFRGRGVARMLLRHFAQLAASPACRGWRPTYWRRTCRCSRSSARAAWRSRSGARGTPSISF